MIENEEEKKVRIRNKINKVIFSEVDLKEVEAITQNHTNIRIEIIKRNYICEKKKVNACLNITNVSRCPQVTIRSAKNIALHCLPCKGAPPSKLHRQ